MVHLIDRYARRAAEEFLAASRAPNVIERDEHRAVAIELTDTLRHLRRMVPSP